MCAAGRPRSRRAVRSAAEGRTQRRRAVAALGVLGAVALLLAACGADPAPSGAGAPATAGPGTAPTAPAAAPPGTATVLAEPAPPATTEAGGPPGTVAAPPATEPLPVTTVRLDLVDPGRPTVSRGTTVAPSRSLPTPVAYPTGPGGPWPLVVFAHGYRLGPPGYTRLIATLAAAGYVVAAPSFPLADEGRAGAAVDRGDLPNQPADLSFVIDGVLAASVDPASPLAGRVDGSRIGAVGHSDGADTVLDLGYRDGRSDPRVRAIVALAPDAVVVPGTTVGAGTPLLIEHGDADSVVPYSESLAVFAAAPSRRYLLTLVGADHLAPVVDATAWTPILDATVLAFLDRYVAGETADDAAVLAAASGPDTRIEVAG